MQEVELIKTDGKTRRFRNLTYRKTRKYILREAFSAQMFYVLMTGSFLAGYLEYLGLDANTSAVLMQLPYLAAAVQLIAPLFYESRSHRMKYFIGLFVAYRMLVAGIGLLALVRGSAALRAAGFCALILSGYSCNYFGEPAFNEFLTNVVPAKLRGRFMSRRDACMIAGGAVSSIVMGQVLDRFRGADRAGLGYTVLFAVAAVVIVVNFICMSRFCEPPVRTGRVRLRLADVFRIPLSNPGYRKFILFHIVYNFSVYVAFAYYSIYQVRNLGLPYTVISLLSLAENLARVFASRYWGRQPSRRSLPQVLLRAIVILAVIHCLWIVMCPATAPFLLPVVHIGGGFAWAGVAVSLLTVNFLFAPRKSRTVYFALNACTGLVTGFLASLVGSAIGRALIGKSLRLGPLLLTGENVIFLVSGFGLLATALYVKCVLREDAVTAD